VELMEMVSGVAGLYVPLSSPLLSVICSSQWSQAAAPATNSLIKAPAIETMIAAPTSMLKSKIYQVFGISFVSFFFNRRRMR
jgi:hypothetical protein